MSRNLQHTSAMITKIIPLALFTAQAVIGAVIRHHDEPRASNADGLAVVAITATLAVPPGPTLSWAVDPNLVIVTETDYTTGQPSRVPPTPTLGELLSYVTIGAPYQNTTLVAISAGPVSAPPIPSFTGASAIIGASTMPYGDSSIKTIPSSAPFRPTSEDNYSAALVAFPSSAPAESSQVPAASGAPSSGLSQVPFPSFQALVTSSHVLAPSQLPPISLEPSSTAVVVIPVSKSPTTVLVVPVTPTATPQRHKRSNNIGFIEGELIDTKSRVSNGVPAQVSTVSASHPSTLMGANPPHVALQLNTATKVLVPAKSGDQVADKTTSQSVGTIQVPRKSLSATHSNTMFKPKELSNPNPTPTPRSSHIRAPSFKASSALLVGSTVVIGEGAHCPYPYPGELCGKGAAKTTFVTATKTKAQKPTSPATRKGEKLESTGWCPYPGQKC
ncbi:uncharacterized protein BDR25DRAFT_311089 [Lindgomyces ingoldianus]|uniref:Uncharacterized protein n=1 Tax=Lindgomyces ingoldianus TaxID=673940 RepID=A0ACB6R620_9PLEO|nr:uncharacterized protein BDR25DRAFT_311089 [Lindgomyces ingoldianus]KAF2474631.1 hypothetical protein BDR25DRAFT_311089 [Lindgomyces ingoldianus]